MKAIQNILVPVDFSGVSENALKYALQLAREVQSTKLYVLHAYRLPATVTFTGYPYGSHYADEIMNTKAIEEEVQNNLKELERKVFKDTDLPYEFILEYGFSEEIIIRAVKDRNIHLVIMGTHGNNPVSRFLGSTTVDIMTQCNCPVLAIPEQAEFRKIQRIAFAADYKKVDKPETFEFLATLADIFHAEIDILHFDVQEKVATKGIKVIDAIEHSLHNIPHTYHHAKVHHVIEGIQNYLEKREAGMLAMMPRQHSFIERLWNGSHTQKMLFYTNIPLLAFHE